MMKLIILLLLTAGQLFAQKVPQIQDRIVGGSIVSGNGTFPYMASLQYNNHHYCGASILANYWLVSAAHCLVGITNISIFSIVVGTTNLSDTQSATFARYPVSKFIVHQYYNPLLNLNDIGLIKTAQLMVYNPNVNSIALNTDVIGKGVNVVISGWGKTSATALSTSPALKYTTISTLSVLNCFFQWFPIVTAANEICTAASFATGSCMGDSGGPMTYQGALVGLVSFGKPCAAGKPDVYTRISSFYKWILANAK